MFETYNTQRHEVMAITSMQAIKLAKAPTENRRQAQDGTETQGSAGQGLTMGEAEKMMKTLVEEGWFDKSQKGYYSLSPRALMELRGWLWETYNDVDEDEDDEGVSKKIKQCFACKEIITTVSRICLRDMLSITNYVSQGQRCPKKTCPCRLHDICTQNFFRTQKSRKCPLCETDWTGKDFVGERAAASTQAKTRKSANGVPRRQSAVIVDEDEADITQVDDQAEEDDEG